MADPLDLKKTLRKRMEEGEADEPTKASAPAPAASEPVRFTRERPGPGEADKKRRGLEDALRKRGY